MEAPEPPGAVENRLSRLLGTIVEGSVARLGFDAATVTARHDDDVATVLTSDQRYIALDEAQYETGEGPCLDALTRLDPIYLKDADHARERWPHFAQAAQHLGVRSTLSLHLPVREGRLAASMKLYEPPHRAHPTARSWRRRATIGATRRSRYPFRHALLGEHVDAAGVRR